MGPTCWNCSDPASPPLGGYNHATGRWDCGDGACAPAEADRRVPVLEVSSGVPVVSRERPAGLRAGARGRLCPGGPLVEVDRVTAGAAYVHKVYDPPLVREVGRDELDASVGPLLAEVQTGTPEAAYQAARRAGHAAEGYRAIRINRGPVEPGISPGSVLYPE